MMELVTAPILCKKVEKEHGKLRVQITWELQVR